MIVTDEEMTKIQQHFPELDINEEGSTILGEISFKAWYDGKKLHLNPSVKSDEVFAGYYEISVHLHEKDFHGLPPVFETSGKIISLSDERKISKMDLHLNAADDSCCLSIFLPQEVRSMTIYKYIIESIFSYFAWHAYFASFDKKPPWGEFSHKFEDGLYEKINDIFISMKTAERNDLCPCGSGLKYKKCCMDKVQLMTRRG